MKKLIIIYALLTFLFPAVAFADSAEGIIINLDQAENTLTLDNGITYELPGEFDFSVLSEGMKVLVFFDVNDNHNYISDIEPESD